jgi:hypothetical protein
VRPLVRIRKLVPVSVFDNETPVGLFGRPRRRESALKTDEATPPIELPDGRFGTGTGWPDIIVAAILATLALQGSATVARQALAELRRGRTVIV